MCLRSEKLDGSSDVLTPLMELLLLDDSTRDGLAEKLMQRDDCELFLFFGTSFARHLSAKAAHVDPCTTRSKRGL